jgi:hypothetical protein
MEAAGTGSYGRNDLALLQSLRLTRTPTAMPSHVEIYHDRIRQWLAGRLAPGVAVRSHLALARALEARQSIDAEMLATQFAAAGEIVAAADYAVRAAQQAEDVLAFDRAARLYPDH